MVRIPAVLLSLFCTGCFSMDTVDLDRQLRENDMFMTEDPAPEGAYPLSTIAVEQVGWYLLGMWAISDISLEDCVQSLVDRAQSMEADGIANIRVDYGPASFFRFSIFPIPDWSATITMTGMAFRMPDPAKAFWKPKPAPGPGR
jgi:hypothetical protein